MLTILAPPHILNYTTHCCALQDFLRCSEMNPLGSPKSE